MSAILDKNGDSAKKEDGELAEMEQLLKSGAFTKERSGGLKNLHQMSDQKSRDGQSSNAGLTGSQVSPSPGKLSGAEGKIFQQNSESQPSALNGFNS